MAVTKDKISKELQEAFLESANMGMEEVGAEDLQMPFIRAIQPLNPQIKKNDSEFIDGASAGDIFNTVTKQYWEGDKGLVVIPVYYQMKFLEFFPRPAAGGFVGEIPTNDPQIAEAQRDENNIEMLKSGNELVRTAQHYVKILHEDGALESAVVDLKKTGLKKSRIWNSLMSMQKIEGNTMPSFACMYRITTVEESNDKGSWYNLNFTLEGTVKELNVFKEAKEFSGALKDGSIALAPPSQEQAQIGSDEEVPF